MMRALVLLTLALPVAAHAQSYRPFAVSAPNMTQGVATQPLSDGSTYSNAGALASTYQQTAATSGTVAMNAGTTVLYLSSATTIASLTVTLPPSPGDGQLVRISSKSGVSLFTIKDAAGTTTLMNGVAIAGTVTVLFQFQSGAWVRLS